MASDILERVEAQLRRLSPENLDLVAHYITSLTSDEDTPLHVKEDTKALAFGDPWEGFYGAFEADVPDLVEHHDYYIGLEAIDPHVESADDTQTRSNS